MNKKIKFVLMAALLLSTQIWAAPEAPRQLAEPGAFQTEVFETPMGAPSRIAKVSPAPLSENEAKIGETEYATFAEAMAVAVSTAGQTKVEVLRDHTESTTAANLFTIPATADVTIELNGYTIHYDHNRASATFLFKINGGKLTIEDHSDPSTGEISMTGATTCGSSYSYNTDLIRVDAGGLLTVNGGTLANYSTGVGCPYVVDVFNSNATVTSSVVINGGLLYQPYNYALRLFGSDRCAQSFTMHGGEVKATRPIWFQLPGASATSPIMDFLMTGGKLSTVKEGGESFSIYSYGQNYDKVTVTVEGGEFVGKFAVGTGTANGGVGNEKVTISGGIFYDEFSSYHRGIERQVIEGGAFYMDLRLKQVQVNGYWGFWDSWFGNYSGYYSKEYYESQGYILYPVWQEAQGQNYVYFFKSGIPLPEMIEYIKPGHYAAIMCDDEDGEFEHEGMKFNPGKCSEEMFWAVIDGEGPISKKEVTEATTTWTEGTSDVKTDVTVGDNEHNATITVEAGTVAETNRLIVNEGSAVIVKTGATLNVGLGGIKVGGDKTTTAIIVEPGGLLTSEGTMVSDTTIDITVQADAVNGGGSLLIAPDINFNKNPLATVELISRACKKNGKYVWQRFGVPANVSLAVKDIKKVGHSYASGYDYWDYSNKKWVAVEDGNFAMLPFVCYQQANDAPAGGNKYAFECNLIGNGDAELHFEPGFNFYANSYTAPIDIYEMLTDYLTKHPDISATAYVYHADQNNWEEINLGTLEEESSTQTDIKPMQAFVFENNGSNQTTKIDYTNYIWEPIVNPKSSSAPRRVAHNNARANIILTGADGMTDRVVVCEDARFSASFDNGYDASKFSEGDRATFALESNDGKMGVIYTDDLAGQALTLTTKDETSYTITFANVRGEQLALRDNLTGTTTTIAADQVYCFSAPANSTIEGRFEIVKGAKAPTAIEENEAENQIRGIYTVTGQYMGTNWNTVPAGVYVVNGQKMVK